MTYRELLAQIQALSPEHLDNEIQYQDTNHGEFLGIEGLGKMSDHTDEGDLEAPILEILQ